MSRRRHPYEEPPMDILEVENEPPIDILEVENEPIVKQPIENPRVVGFVDGCEKLNVRKEPNKESDVVTVIDRGLEVTIDPEKSSTEWYAINTVGVEGFVMSKFIKSDAYMNLDGIERWKAF